MVQTLNFVQGHPQLTKTLPFSRKSPMDIIYVCSSIHYTNFGLNTLAFIILCFFFILKAN